MVVTDAHLLHLIQGVLIPFVSQNSDINKK